MALEQKLSLKLSQKLVMTPSLQQAIKLLQMTRLELEGVLTQELVENPVLEDTTYESDMEGEEEGDGVDAAADDDKAADDASDGEEGPEETETDPMDDIDLDAYFNDYLGASDSGGFSTTYEPRQAVPLENTLSRDPDLYDHLLWQVHMADIPDRLRELAELVVGNLDTDGFLAATVEEIQLLGAEPDEVDAYREALARWQAAQPDPESEADGEEAPEDPTGEPTEPSSEESAGDDGGAAPAEGDSPEGEVVVGTAAPAEPPGVPGYPRVQVEKAIAFVRTLDPPGVGQRDLRDSLRYQLAVVGEEDTLAYRLVDECWNRFLKRQFSSIAKEFGVPMRELEEPVERIKGLELRPGRLYNNDRTQYVEPDVAVVKVGGEYVVQLNDDGLPRLRISGAYRKMLRDLKREGRQGDAQKYIKEKMRGAMWLIKSLDQRQRTIYKVANSIVKQQQEFFDQGIDKLRPMVLRDVAEDIGMHESTVSRVVSNKYIHTPRGLLPMKFFFHSGIDRDYGEDISSLSVKRKIEDFIEEEDPKKPLSDSELMRRLQREGIKIARRTVAKYRDELNIPSSTDRKQIF